MAAQDKLTKFTMADGTKDLRYSNDGFSATNVINGIIHIVLNLTKFKMADGTKGLQYYQLIAIQNRIVDYSIPNNHPSTLC